MNKLLNKKFFSQGIVKIKYEHLIQNKKTPMNLFKNIEEAYGKNGIGLLVVQDVPKVLEIKRRLFKNANTLINLDEEAKKKVERPELSYSLGYSYGKEYFSDKPDFLKASFYAQLLQHNSENPIDKNIWPYEIPDLQRNFLALGNLIREIGFVLGSVIDSYIQSVYPSYNLNYHKIIEESKENTGRLLYYFPKKFAVKNKDIDPDNWCEWHNDHGSLTGLVSANYLKETGEEATGLKLDKTGLYAQRRNGEIIRVTYGKEDIAFQLGETLQIHSGGILHATPHAVKVMDDIPDDIARVTFALFMEPNLTEKLSIPKGSKIENISTSDIYKVPKLQDRFKEGMNFGDFSKATFASFYKN